jgi:hypothetical protein
VSAKVKPIEEWTRAGKDAARAILLEKSPYGVDGGELIGRDPRSIAAGEFHQAGIDGAAILAVIRAKCLDCCVHQPDEVRKCVAVLCPNWPFRMGTNPFRSVNVSDEERERRRAQGRTLAASRHGTVSGDVKITSANLADDSGVSPPPGGPMARKRPHGR